MKMQISHRNGLLLLINLMFFLVGMLVSIMSALMPNIIKWFEISYSIAATLPFAFYLSFAFLSFPVGVANGYFSPKKIIIFALFLILLGVFLFVIFINYTTSLISLFVVGSAVVIIQVSSVPLLRRICGGEKFAFHSTLNQLIYGLGAFISPHIFSFFNTLLKSDLKESFPLTLLSLVVPKNYEWVSAYWLIAMITILILIVVIITKFPSRIPESENSERKNRGYWKLLKNKYIISYFIVLVLYASCEQGSAVWMTKYFQDYYALNPDIDGSYILSGYWILLSVGCFVGMIALKILDSRIVLGTFTMLGIVSLVLVLYTDVKIARITFPLFGLFESVMWPIVLSLAINSVDDNHETVTGFMFMASIGGAFGPFIIGSLSDYYGLHFGLHYLFIPLIIIFSVAFWASPLISNQTIQKVIVKTK